MKVKHFVSSPKSEEEYKEFDNEINEFIKDKKVMDIKYSVSSFGYEEPHVPDLIIENATYSALVMYEEV